MPLERASELLSLLRPSKRIQQSVFSRTMGRLGIELLLVAFALLMTLGFIITYIVAVQQDHVTPDLPYISDTGGQVPEQCIFSLICNLGSILILIIVLVRFKHIHQYYSEISPGIKCLNGLSVVLGFLSASGIIIVGSFQDDSVPIVHFIGALLAFGLGIIYEWLQTYFSYRIYHSDLTHRASSAVFVVQLLLCILSPLFFLTSVVTGLIAIGEHTTNENKHGGSSEWKQGDGGFALHVVSTATEWAAAGSFMLYFLTFHSQFKRLQLEVNVRLRYQAGDGHINEHTPLTF